MIGENGRVTNQNLYELVSYRGEIFGPYSTMEEAARSAKEKWPHQHQDEDREGLGWDIQVAGS